MRHRVDGKKLSRTTSHRRALRRNMAAALIQHGAIRTTEPKAKQLRRFVEKLITMAKKDTLHARRQVVAKLTDRELFNDEGELEEATLVQKLFGEIAPRYADRPGGYTRIIRLAERRIGDAGRQVLLQLVEEDIAEGGGGGASRRKKRAAMLHGLVAAVVEAEPETQADDADESDDAEADDEAAESQQPAEDADQEDQGEQKK